MGDRPDNFPSDCTVLVTAGASGIGRCIAQAFLAGGCNVHICDIDAAAIEAFLDDNPSAKATRANVSVPAEVDRLFEDLQAAWGRLDVLVNNAGIAGPTGAVDEISDADWDATIAVDLNGQFYVTSRAVPLLRAAGGGSIINMSSNAGLHGFPLRSPYTASKWALIGLTKTWAMELGTDSIRVNALCPGSVNGPRIEGVITRDAQERGLASEDIRDIYQRQSSMRLFVDPEDIANMAVFLASQQGATISGQAIAIDGHTEGLSNWLS